MTNVSWLTSGDARVSLRHYSQSQATEKMFASCVTKIKSLPFHFIDQLLRLSANNEQNEHITLMKTKIWRAVMRGYESSL